MTTADTGIDPALFGVHPSPPGTLEFAPALRTRAFLLRRERGNLVIYGTPTVGAETGGAEALGRISRVYVNHWHEAASGDASDAPLFVHAGDREEVAKYREVAATFSKRHRLDDDFEAIPTPGHTPGATTYLWENAGHRFLFTGDTIYLRDGEWVAAVLDSSDRERYIESLELIRELDFNVLVPWIATADGPYFAVTDRRDTRRRVDGILRRAREGRNR